MIRESINHFFNFFLFWWVISWVNNYWSQLFLNNLGSKVNIGDVIKFLDFEKTNSVFTGVQEFLLLDNLEFLELISKVGEDYGLF